MASTQTRKPLTAAQIQQLWVREGGSRDWATTMAQIAARESSGKYWINNAGLNKNGTVDHGLFQINDIWRSDPVIQRIGWQNRYDPVANTKMAVRVFQAQGPKAWATYQGHVANVPTTSGIPGTPRATPAAPAGAAGPAAGRYATTTTRTTTTPGVDNSQLRRSLIADFLGSGGVKSTQATQQLAAGWLSAQDVPGTSSTATTTTPGRAAAPAAAPATRAPRGGVSPHARPGSPVASSRSVGGLHETMGLPGYPAHDYFAPAGSHAVAPVTGTVIRLSGHDPSAGPVQGPHGPLGWSVYIKGSDGRTYYLTHMGSRNVKPGQKVKQGQVIGTVANYDKYGTPSHIHMGVNG